MALYAPSVIGNIISDSELRKHCDVVHTNEIDPCNDTVTIIDKISTTVLMVFNRNSQGIFTYRVPSATSDPIVEVLNTSAVLSVSLAKKGYTKSQISAMEKVERLHRQTSYIGLSTLARAIKNNVIQGAEDITYSDVINYQTEMHKDCTACKLGKMIEAPAPIINDSHQNPMTCHVDVLQLTSVDSTFKILYVIGVDARTQFVMVSRIKDQTGSELLRALNSFITVYKSHRRNLIQFRLDNAAGFTGAATMHSIERQGIELSYCTPGRHVRIAEVAIRIVKTLARTTMLASKVNVPIRYGTCLLEWTVETVNFLPRSSNEYVAPYTLFTGQPIHVDRHLRLGFMDVVLVRDNKRFKDLEPRGRIAVVIAREKSYRGGFICVDPSTNKTSKRYYYEALTDQSIFDRVNQGLGLSRIMEEPFEPTSLEDLNKDEIDLIDSELTELEESLIRKAVKSNPESVKIEGGITSEPDKKTTSDGEAMSESDDRAASVPEGESISKPDNRAVSVSISEEGDTDEYEGGTNLFDDFEEANFQDLEPSDDIILSTSVHKLRMMYDSDAVDKAIAEEIQQMHTKRVWTYLLPSEWPTSQVLPVQMIVKPKFDSANRFIKIKARLVALGNLQKTSEGSKENEAPTAALLSFFILIVIASKRRIPIETIDIKGAFLNADMQDNVNIRLDKETSRIITQQDPNLSKYLRNDLTIVTKLRKCLYGLKQSPRRWFETVMKILVRLGFRSSEHDNCLMYIIDTTFNYILLFVDDILVVCQRSDLVDNLKASLEEAFEEITTQSGPVISFLGFRILQSDSHITLDQTGYIDKLASTISNIKPNKYPSRTNFLTSKERYLKPESEANPILLTKLKSLVMKIMYVAMRTRKDVLFLASFYSSIRCPNEEDIEELENIIGYLHNSKDRCMYFYREGELDPSGFADASHNSFANARGQIATLIYPDKTSAPIDGSSNRESGGIALSSTESELSSQVELVKRIRLVSQILTELGQIHNRPLKLYMDNQAAVILANTEQINRIGRTKFINRNMFYANHFVQKGDIVFEHIYGTTMPADILTKPLTGERFLALIGYLFTRK
jgi:hypothetical protein